MSSACAQCGAVYQSGGTCQERFEACLALEYENPEAYGAVHLLSVACYMLQHNLYSRDGWLEARRMVAQTVIHETTPAEIREKNWRKLASGQRKWSVTKGEKLAEFEAIRWSLTIADVKHWAMCVLEDTHWMEPD
jgi:hypothetical protein